jgi:hypothetical protein
MLASLMLDRLAVTPHRMATHGCLKKGQPCCLICDHAKLAEDVQ